MALARESMDANASQNGDSEHLLPEGVVIGDYRVVRLIGAGSFGMVYEGLHPLIGKRVAIKVLAHRYSADAEAVSRFIAEARVVNEIRHRNIVDIFSFNQLPDGRQYFVMEFLDGPTLEGLLQEKGKLEPAQAVPLLREVASALDAAHRMGVAHRDIKPANIMIVSEEGRPSAKLIDFGLAKLSRPEAELAHQTKTGAMMGTPKYMSPEQCRSKPADHRSDVYAFGLIAYEMLTGAAPFAGKDSFDFMLHHTRTAPRPLSQVNPELGRGFDAALLATLEKEPEKRPGELLPVVEALEALVGSAPARRRSAAARMALPVAVLAALALGGWSLLGQRAPADPPEVRAPAVPVAPAAPPPAAAPEPAPPALVELRVDGLEGAEIRDATGAVLGTVPGTIRLPRGEQSVTLTADREGFESKAYAIIPAADQPLTIDLAAKKAPRAAPPVERKKKQQHELEKVF